VRSLDEQTILITGSTDGLGLELARRLAGAGATLVIHGRNPQRLERALMAVGGARHRDRVHGVLADFGSRTRFGGWRVTRRGSSSAWTSSSTTRASPGPTAARRAPTGSS
jgi:NAD(P)-dependent dehydrogenase (short-subunit alcohol dehydrogenase family)